MCLSVIDRTSYKMAYLPLIRTIFKVAGLWGNEKLNKIHLYIIRFVFGIDVHYWFGLTYHLYLCITDNQATFSQKSDALFIFTAYSVLLSNFIVLFRNKEKTKEMFEELENFENFGYPKNLTKITKILDIFCFCTVCYCGIGSLMFAWLGNVQYESCLKQSQIENNELMRCGFLFQISYPYDIREGVLLYIHLYLQVCISSVFFFGSQLMISSIAVVELICIRLDHLADLLQQVIQKESDDNQETKFRNCIMYHIHIIELTEKINNNYKAGTTIVIMSYGITVGSILMVVFEKYSLLSVISFIGFTVVVFLLCHSGQRLHDKSLMIGEIAFGLDWYNSNKKLKRDILFLIMRSNKPLTYSCAWGIGEFYMKTFKKVMTAAYKFTSLKTTISK